jgi:hypothetical protein
MKNLLLQDSILKDNYYFDFGANKKGYHQNPDQAKDTQAEKKSMHGGQAPI